MKIIKFNVKLFTLLAIIFFSAACKKSGGGTTPLPPPPPPPPPAATNVSVVIDKSVKFQTIEGFGFFGAHDVWWAAAGNVWNDAWGQKVITDLGITMWRNEIFPPATPSAGQDADWAKQKAVVEGLKAIATANNVNLKFLATVWSPPADLKWTATLTWAGDANAVRQSGVVSTKNGGTLSPEKYTEYANWLKENIQLYKNSGVDLYGLSLQNELMFSQSFNSCVYTSAWYNQMVNAVVPLVKAGFPNVKIFGAENMLDMEGKDINWPVFYHSGIKANATTASLIDVLAVHGYTDGVAASSGSELAKMWTNHLTQFSAPMNKPAWMTETSGYDDTWESSGSKPGAINLAMDMHSGLYYGNMSAWVWWQGSGGAGSAGAIGDFELMKGVNTGKKYAVSKQFYRYIRPGAVRLKTSSDNDNVFVTAYENTDKGQHTIVIINNGDAKSVSITGTGLPDSYKMYRSSASENCVLIGDADVSGSNKISIPAKAVVTLQAGGDAL